MVILTETLILLIAHHQVGLGVTKNSLNASENLIKGNNVVTFVK